MEDGASNDNAQLAELRADVRNHAKAIDDLWKRDEKRGEVIQAMRDEQIKMRTTLWVIGLLVSPVVTALLVAMAMAASGLHK